MPYSTWVDDHSNTYSTPYIPNKIVGFHGIDPDLVLPETEVPQWFSDYQEFIRNNSSGEAGDADDEIVPISHEKLDDLIGGDENYHYHLTEAEYEGLRALMTDKEGGKFDYLLTEEDYNALTEILEALGADVEEKGVAILTRDEYNKLIQLFNVATPEDGNSEPTFFSEDEYNKITAILNAVYPAQDTTEPVFINTDTLNSLIDARIADYMANNQG